jgi:putative ABC transport system permease protein
MRFALAASAMAIAVSLVIAITSGFAGLHVVIRSFVNTFMGSVDFEITWPNSGKPSLDQSLIDQLRADPRVRAAHGRLEQYFTPLAPDGAPANLPRQVTLFGVVPAEDSILTVLPTVQGRWFASNTAREVVIDNNVLELLREQFGETYGIGSDFVVGTSAGPQKFQIVGVVHMPSLVRMAFLSGFTPAGTMQDILPEKVPGKFDKLRGEFNTEVDSEQFLKDWQRQLAAVSPNIELELKRKTREALDNNLVGMRMLSMMGSSISMLAAAFIVFTTLSMGVAERQRQLAMLRAIGATRSQVAGMVLSEGVLLSIAGLLIGIPLGKLLLIIMHQWQPNLFSGPLVIDTWGLIFAAVASCSAGFLAGIIPAFKASQSSPLEAMAHQGTAPLPRVPWRMALVGLALASVDTVVCLGYASPLANMLGVNDREMAAWLHFGVGIPLLMVGFFMMSPMVVWVVEGLLGRPVALLGGLRFELLRHQLSGSVWRAAGTASALMVGLCVLIVMNAQGRSTLQRFELPSRFPDVFMIAEGGLGTMNDQVIDGIRKTTGVASAEVLPIQMTIPAIGDSTLAPIRWISKPDSVMFISAEPHTLFKMIDLQFHAGDVATADRMMTRGKAITLSDDTEIQATIESPVDFESYRAGVTKTAAKSIDIHTLDGKRQTLELSQVSRIEPGRYVVVTHEFKNLQGKGVGATTVLTAGQEGRRFTYTVVGIIWSPGIDLILNAYDMPNRVQAQTIYTVFGNTIDARRDFGAGPSRIVAANVAVGADRDKLMSELRHNLGGRGVSVIDVREFKGRLTLTFQRMLDFASLVAWAAMLVASLGISNTIIAAIRSRQWQLGILRSIGTTRSQLFRLILAESLLLGISGVVLGTLSGILMAFNSRSFYRRLLGLEGNLIVPWDLVLLGGSIIVALAIVMSLWPGISTARREPLELLRAGRSAG